MEDEVQQSQQTSAENVVVSNGQSASASDGDIQEVTVTPEVTMASLALKDLQSKFTGILTPKRELDALTSRGILADQGGDGTVYVYEDSNGVPYFANQNQVHLADIDDMNRVPVDFDKLYESLDYVTANNPDASSIVQRMFTAEVPVIPEQGTPTAQNFHGTFFDPGPALDSTGRDLNAGDSTFGELNAIYWNPEAAPDVTKNDLSVPGKAYVIDTNRNLSPALSFLHEIDHAVGYSISPLGNWVLSHSLTHDSITNLEEARVITGLPADYASKLIMNSPDAIAGVNAIVSVQQGSDLEDTSAMLLGEPVRENHVGIPPLFKLFADPTHHT